MNAVELSANTLILAAMLICALSFLAGYWWRARLVPHEIADALSEESGRLNAEFHEHCGPHSESYRRMNDEPIQDLEKALIFLFIVTGEAKHFDSERQCRILARLSFDNNVRQAEVALEECLKQGLSGKTEMRPIE